jgi:uncharacterized protein YdiU (UPF0061 family)
MILFPPEQSYAEDLEGFYVPWTGEVVPSPRVVQVNAALAVALGLDPEVLASPGGAALLVGSEVPDGATPLAQAYAGHQFGNFVPQLGDGRALLLGEVIDQAGRRRDIHLKGSGRTPFSRGGDGKAVLGPVLREYLMGEAMHALGVPTTRALAAVTTGEEIRRQGPRPEPGAVLVRVASSHIRVGTFQYFAARGRADQVRQLAEYAIRRHDPHLAEGEDRFVAFFRAVRDRQAKLVARWMSVGFVHGVMNTDNTAISGETLDYGPCAFIDRYDPRAVFSSIDHHGRYAYENQAGIAQWNLARLAETLLLLAGQDEQDAWLERLTDGVHGFSDVYAEAWMEEMRRKLGLREGRASDRELVEDLLGLMDARGVDFTLLFRGLADVLRGDRGRVDAAFRDPRALDPWLARWHHRLEGEGTDARDAADRMDAVNPLYIPRNHKVEEALQAASAEADFAPFRRLLEVLEAPFARRPGLGDFEGPAPEGFGPYVTFCGT